LLTLELTLFIYYHTKRWRCSNVGRKCSQSPLGIYIVLRYRTTVGTDYRVATRSEV